IASQPLRIEAVAESGTLERGVVNFVYLVVSSLEGQPVMAEVNGRGGPGDKEAQGVKFSPFGGGRLNVTPERADASSELSLTIVARTDNNLRAEVTRKLPLGRQQDGVLLRPDRAVYHTGDTARLEVLAAGPTGRVFLDVVKERRTVMMHS